MERAFSRYFAVRAVDYAKERDDEVKGLRRLVEAYKEHAKVEYCDACGLPCGPKQMYVKYCRWCHVIICCYECKEEAKFVECEKHPEAYYCLKCTQRDTSEYCLCHDPSGCTRCSEGRTDVEHNEDIWEREWGTPYEVIGAHL